MEPTKKITSFGFIKDLFGYVHCKDHRQLKICMCDSLLPLFKHGDFIQFEAEFSDAYGIYLIEKAEIDVTGVRYEMATITGIDGKPEEIYAYYTPLRLHHDRRRLRNDDIGVVNDRTGSRASKMMCSSLRKFWVVFSDSDSQTSLRVLNEEEEKHINKLNPDDASLRTLRKDPRLPKIPNFPLSKETFDEIQEIFGTVEFSSEEEEDDDDQPLNLESMDENRESDRHSTNDNNLPCRLQKEENFGKFVVQKSYHVAQMNELLGVELQQDIIKLIYEYELKAQLF